MNIKTYNTLKDLENYIENSIPITIFRGYTAINKRGVEKLIDELYANLPNDVKNARAYLKEKNIELNNQQKNKIYNSITNFKETLNKSFHFAKYVIVNVHQLENLLDKIYTNIPEEINQARTLELTSPED